MNLTDIPISTTGNTVSVVGPSTSSTPLSVPGPSSSSTPLTSILGTPVRICTTISPILQQLKAPTCITKGRAAPQA